MNDENDLAIQGSGAQRIVDKLETQYVEMRNKWCAEQNPVMKEKLGEKLGRTADALRYWRGVARER